MHVLVLSIPRVCPVPALGVQLCVCTATCSDYSTSKPDFYQPCARLSFEIGGVATSAESPTASSKAADVVGDAAARHTTLAPRRPSQGSTARAHHSTARAASMVEHSSHRRSNPCRAVQAHKGRGADAAAGLSRRDARNAVWCQNRQSCLPTVARWRMEDHIEYSRCRCAVGPPLLANRSGARPTRYDHARGRGASAAV